MKYYYAIFSSYTPTIIIRNISSSMPITRTANGIMLVVVVKLATFPNNSTELQLRAQLYSK
jgi:hypothetical protein